VSGVIACAVAERIDVVAFWRKKVEAPMDTSGSLFGYATSRDPDALHTRHYGSQDLKSGQFNFYT
jgi:hypothetical protein